MEGLEYICGELLRHNINVDIWVDGSFVTEKINPQDSDIVLCLQASVYDNGNQEQRSIIDAIGRREFKSSHLCDSYVFLEYPKSHPLYEESQWMRAYWMKQYGFSRDEKYKGIAVISTNE